MEARDLSKARSHPFQLSLRIRHPSIDPAEISRELKLDPEYSFKAGEPRESSSGSALTAVHSESYWLGSLEPTAWPTLLSGFEKRLTENLTQTSPRSPLVTERAQGAAVSMMANSLGVALELSTMYFLRAHSEFMRRLQGEGGQVSVLVEAAPRSLTSFTIGPQIGRVLTDLGVAIEFEFVSG